MDARVKEIMTTDVLTATPQTTIREAIKTFREYRIDSIPIIEAGKLKGLFSKSSVYKAFLAEVSLDAKVEEFMEEGTDVKIIAPESKIEDAWNIEVGRLPVVNQYRKVVGILTRTDLMSYFVKRAEEYSAYLNAVLDSTYNAVIAIDLHGKISIFNKSAEKITAWKAEEAIGQDINNVIPNTALLEIIKTGKPSHSQRMDIGGHRVISNRSPIYHRGELIGAVAIVQEISSLESISEELQAIKNLNKELEAIIESCHDAIVVADRYGKLEKLNSAYERITGIPVKELVGKNMRQLEDTGVVSQSVSLLVLEQCKPITILQRLHTGREIIVTGTPVIDENGAIIKVVTTGRDMTELNSLKEEMERTKELSNRYYNELKQLKRQMCNQENAIFASEKMQQIAGLCEKVAEVDSSVLLLGESGVGKEILAKIVHNYSVRKGKAFVKINCGAIQENLLESELFGYDEGAFTGARKGGKLGHFEMADKGTIFLDEIGELPLGLQVKLLRVLQEQEIMRVGGTSPIKIDVRIIAATNKDLASMVKSGNFREDLYYRLNIIPIKIPPLRDRKEDIIPLVHHFLQRLNEKYRVNKRLSANVLAAMMEHEWPGNVRELENIIERLVVTSDTNELIWDEAVAFGEIMADDKDEELILVKRIIPLKQAVRIVEQVLIKKALNKYGTTRKAAKALGVNASTIVRKNNLPNES